MPKLSDIATAILGLCALTILLATPLEVVLNLFSMTLGLGLEV